MELYLDEDLISDTSDSDYYVFEYNDQMFEDEEFTENEIIFIKTIISDNFNDNVAELSHLMELYNIRDDLIIVNTEDMNYGLLNYFVVMNYKKCIEYIINRPNFNPNLKLSYERDTVFRLCDGNITKNKIEILKKLIQCGCNPNLPNIYNRTPLIHLAEKIYLKKKNRNYILEFIDIILNNTDNINQFDDDQESFLYYSLFDDELFDKGLKFGADINTVNDSGKNVLMLFIESCIWSHFDFVKIFTRCIECGIDLNKIDKNGLSVLDYSYFTGHIEFIEFFISHGFVPSKLFKYDIRPLKEFLYKIKMLTLNDLIQNDIFKFIQNKNITLLMKYIIKQDMKDYNMVAYKKFCEGCYYYGFGDIIPIIDPLLKFNDQGRTEINNFYERLRLSPTYLKMANNLVEVYLY